MIRQIKKGQFKEKTMGHRKYRYYNNILQRMKIWGLNNP